MDCGEYQKDNRWLRNRVLVKMTEGNISEGWIVMNIRETMGLRNRIGIISERWIVVEMILLLQEIFCFAIFIADLIFLHLICIITVIR